MESSEAGSDSASEEDKASRALHKGQGGPVSRVQAIFLLQPTELPSADTHLFVVLTSQVIGGVPLPGSPARSR